MVLTGVFPRRLASKPGASAAKSYRATRMVAANDPCSLPTAWRQGGASLAYACAQGARACAPAGGCSRAAAPLCPSSPCLRPPRRTSPNERLRAPCGCGGAGVRAPTLRRAAQVSDMLDRLYRRLDSLALTHGVYKAPSPCLPVCLCLCPSARALGFATACILSIFQDELGSVMESARNKGMVCAYSSRTASSLRIHCVVLLGPSFLDLRLLGV